ncbi:hypothetical protein SHKM778_86790 [Streptomyces sp. KM77-8]|uniref:Endonuclease/exonuclease/phosphatase domain-containing protein n=1 Tax=Streptomyces haneummycinicus TaxID=3074435 RepID=A0AAT9HY21_9ACTN
MSYRALMLTVTSVNVNGLRAAAKKGFVEWLAGTSADVICLQEVRAEAKQLPEGVREPEGWHVVHAPAAAKGRAGVSLYSRRAPERTRIGFGSDEFDDSGRYVEIDLPGVTVASLYLPSGRSGPSGRTRRSGSWTSSSSISRSCGCGPPPRGARSSCAGTGTSPMRRPT